MMFQIKLIFLFSIIAFNLESRASIRVSQKTINVLRDLESIQNSSFRSDPVATCTIFPDGSTPLVTVTPVPPNSLSEEGVNEYIHQKVTTQSNDLRRFISRLRGGSENESPTADDIRENRNRDALIPTLEALNADMLVVGNSYYTTDQQQRLPMALEDARSLLRELEEAQRTLQFCEFKRQIDFEIRSVSEASSHQLQILNSITRCLGEQQIATGYLPESMVEMANPVFESIFHEFSNKRNLSDEDCTVLSRTYQVWSSFYDQENNRELESRSETIPLYNVNPHNSSYFYWLREVERGNIPPGGLTLLHADTHTDLGHIHNHIRDDLYGSLRSRDITPLLRNLRRGKETFLNSLETYLRNSGRYNEGDYRPMVNAFRSQSVEEIRNSLETLARRSVHEIAQPLVGAVNAGLTDRLIMCLPPWSPRLPRSIMRNGRAEFEEVVLASGRTNNRIELVSDDRDLTESHDSPIAVFNRGTHRAVRENISLATTDCNEEVEEFSRRRSNLPGFESYMGERERENGFILDIDLDVFVSEGYEEHEDDSVHSPQSWQRAIEEVADHNQEEGSHDGHDQSNETNSPVQISSNELLLIKERVDNFFDRLESARDDGILPRVITISDSTMLTRMIQGQSDDSLSGGNFTPSCLAFLLNYMVRIRLNNLYDVEESR